MFVFGGKNARERRGIGIAFSVASRVAASTLRYRTVYEIVRIRRDSA